MGGASRPDWPASAAIALPKVHAAARHFTVKYNARPAQSTHCLYEHIDGCHPSALDVEGGE
jgi:hypothetical protein